MPATVRTSFSLYQSDLDDLQSVANKTGRSRVDELQRAIKLLKFFYESKAKFERWIVVKPTGVFYEVADVQ